MTTSTLAGGVPTSASDRSIADWRTALPEAHRRPLRAWFWSIAAMTLGVLIIGGITRLTQSGLSIVDWDPLMGVIPPLGDAQWQEAFERYRQFPEYQKLREGMSLGQFRFIFFWEYLHRLMARAIGLVFLVPFVFLALRGWLRKPLMLRALGLFALGAMQGVMGWIMVASGLVDRPSVSHYRLAAHLSLAFVIFGYAVWLARELKVVSDSATLPSSALRLLRRGLLLMGALLGLQVIWGAFVAGLDAGFFHNTFPLMAGRWVPADLAPYDPAVVNFLVHPVAVQWTHRVLGTLLTLAALGLAWWALRAPLDALSRRYAVTLAGLTLGQYLLGVVTLLLVVPVPLGVAHQALAMVLFGVWVMWVHHARVALTSPS
ncbi:MAG: COX15/CtaA family protein [Gemmatimonadota bacterium]